MENTMKQSSNANCGFIVWLSVTAKLPPLEDIKADVILPTGASMEASCEKLKAAARRFEDIRFKKDYYTDTCNFNEMRLSKGEREYIDNLGVDPMKWAKEVDLANDWHALPLVKLEVEDKVFLFIDNFEQIEF